MYGTHDVALVWVSMVIAVAASYAALDLAGRIAGHAGSGRSMWTAAASLVMGGGIWAMHFVAMLAYRMPGMSFGYDVRMTFLSFVVAVGATFTGFTIMSRYRGSTALLLGAGAFMGLGVVAMHYIGMAAMRMHASISYDPFWVGISIMVAFAAATAALWLSFRNSGLVERAGASVVMGVAVAGMHYSAMQGVSFGLLGDTASAAAASGLGQTAMALGIAATVASILVIALSASVFDRRLAELSGREALSLRLSEERFRNIYRGTPLPLHSLDAEGRIEQVSNTWLDLTGYGRDDVVGRPIADFMTADSGERFMREDMLQLAERGFVIDREHCLVTSSGEVRDVLVSVRTDRDGEGRFLGILGGLTDVTERRQAEEALRQAQKLEAMGQLTGGVAHDFNNLLAVIVGNLDLARRRVADDPRTLRYVESALEGATRGASLTQRLLSFARRQDLRPAAIEVPKLVSGMSELMRRTIGPMVSVEISFPGDLPSAQVDAHQLEMAILNLVVNARDAMPDGGVVAVSARSVSDPDGARLVSVVVSDAGCGMDEATLARAGEPFFTTKGVGKGTGLGLSMAQGLAAQSGGRLSIRSKLGVGTTVELLLPEATEAPSKVDPAPARPVEAVQQRPLSILVVDDDPLVLDNTVAMLEDLGHHVASVASGREALSVLPALRDLDLVITDQMMPGMTGVQLADAIARTRPFLPILVASGYSDLCLGGSSSLPMLPKPFGQAALSAAVALVMAGAKVVEMGPRRRLVS